MSRAMHVAVLGNAGFSLWLARRMGAAALSGELPCDEHGAAALAQLLANEPRRPWFILVDQVEEEFVLERLPSLGAADRKALLARKLEQHFRQTPYRCLRRISRRHRADGEAYLLSGLTQPAPLDFLVDVMLQRRAALAGISSVTQVLGGWYRRWGNPAASPHTLLLCELLPGLWRQAYFNAEGLRFARQAGLQEHERGSALASEILRTRQYLATLRQLARDEILEVLLCDPGLSECELASLRNQLAGDDAAIRLRLIGLAELGQPAASWLEAALGELARGRVADQYALPEQRRYQRLRQGIRALHWMSAGLVLASLLVAAAMLWGVDSQQPGHARLQQRLNAALAQQRQFSILLDSRPGFDPAWMDASVRIEETLFRRWPDPELAARQLSQILLDFPGLTIDRYEWQLGQRPQLAATLQQSAASQVAEEAEVSVLPGTEFVLLGGHLQAEAGEYRQAMQEFERLMQRIAAMPGVSVEPVQLPIGTRGSEQAQSVAAVNGRHDFLLLLARPAAKEMP
ncbi:hypothetical protein [Chitinilyticum piscinae]|uniref:Uncharacterized protein n=1 Tax=Chitinilyticum piscinae TaxID=2866724 RepID=A0A8J7K7A7_9NEIS|nr:hypothetical protein [Chitinilyticum piscinae]MBE9607753.1 hypothetical protein [Chitinilyticum piscinae]